MSALGALTIVMFLLPGNLFAGTLGNTLAQEVADVVFRDMDIYVSRHNGIYIGQTNKSGNPATEPFFHGVIEMTGIVKSYVFFATKVEHIRVVNFGEFQKAHPAYYGAFKQRSDYDIEKRRKILDTAEALRFADPQIEYVVEPWEFTSRLLYQYFKLKDKETLEYYGAVITLKEKISMIARMRSDAFVEFCYAAAGVPIAKDSFDNSLNLTTSTGAATLILMAHNAQLFPDNQWDWMTPSDVAEPELRVIDTFGNTVSNVASVSTVTFLVLSSLN